MTTEESRPVSLSKVIYLISRERREGINRHRSCVHNFASCGNHLKRDSNPYSAHKANGDLVTLRVRNIPTGWWRYEWIYERLYVWNAKKDSLSTNHSCIQNLTTCSNPILMSSKNLHVYKKTGSRSFAYIYVYHQVISITNVPGAVLVSNCIYLVEFCLSW